MSSGAESGNEQTLPPTLDASLIDEMLALSHEERLRHNDRLLRTIKMLRPRCFVRDASSGPGRNDRGEWPLNNEDVAW